MDAKSVRIGEFGTLTMSGAVWDRTKLISAVIAPLAARAIVGRSAVDAAAATLGISRRQVYVLITRHRDGSGLLTDLTPGRSSGGKGTSRRADEVEDLVRTMVREQFLTRQKRTLAVVHRDIAAACRARGLPAPSRSTVERRIQALNPVDVGRAGPDAVRSLQSAGGAVPVIEGQATVTDEIIDLHDRIIGKFFNTAKNKHVQQFQASGKSINDKVRLYGQIGQALLEAKLTGADPFEAIESVISWDGFAASVDEACKLAQPENFDFLHHTVTAIPQCAATPPNFSTSWTCVPRPGQPTSLRASRRCGP